MEKTTICRDITGATSIKSVAAMPEEVTATTMRKFCFRRVDHKVIVVYLENKEGQPFEIKIDESTARAIARLFDSEDPKV